MRSAQSFLSTSAVHKTTFSSPCSCRVLARSTMAVGKPKQGAKGAKRGSRKKAVDPFLKKEWYDVKAPSMFSTRQVGKTLITRTQGTKIASEGLKGRIFEVSQGDLQKDEDNAFRKMRLKVEEVQGRACLTNFWGMTFTTDKIRSLVRKWQSLIEAHVDVKTTDGYSLRLFCIGFTKKRKDQASRTCYAQVHSHLNTTGSNSLRLFCIRFLKKRKDQASKTCYAQTSQAKAIRKKMVDIMRKETEICDLGELVRKLIPESIGIEIERACSGIYPLQNVYIRKAKILKAPKFDITKLMEMHQGGEITAGAAVGDRIDRPEGLIAPAEEVGEIEGDY